MKKKNFLVTGGTGFIGAGICRMLILLGHKVTIFDDNSRGKISRILKIEKKVKFIKGDKSFFEREPLQKISKLKQLYAFKHKGFWQCMDTLRDKEILEKKIKEKKNIDS